MAPRNPGDRTTPMLDRMLAGGPPLELGDWALRPADLELVLELIAAGRERIVECGSGASTIAIARLLAARGRGRLHAIEHDREWATLVGNRIEAEGLGDRALVLEAPLCPHPLAEPGCRWYDEEALAGLPDRIDLLLIDGPPAGGEGRERTRYPALPALAPRLGPGATVVLDDAERPGERWALDRWRRELPISFAGLQGERTAIGCMFPPKMTRQGPGAWETDTERKE